MRAHPQFKQVAVAYQVLSDPELRHKYNEFGQKNGGAEDQLHDPEEVFGKMFGGDRFEELIGDISIGTPAVTHLGLTADPQART